MTTMGTKALTRGIEQLDFLVAALCGVVLLLEGYDIAAIGYAVPSIADAWRLAPSSFTPALVAGNVGLLLGSVGVGILGDRLGRKPVLIGCVVVFGAFFSIHRLCRLALSAFGSALANRIRPGRWHSAQYRARLRFCEADETGTSSGSDDIGSAHRLHVRRIAGKSACASFRLARDFYCGRRAAVRDDPRCLRFGCQSQLAYESREAIRSLRCSGTGWHRPRCCCGR